MSPAAGGAAPAQSAAAVVAPAIAGQEPDRAPARRDPPGPAEVADPANAAARKPVWGVLAPSPAAAAAANPASGIIGGDASWPALVELKRGWPKSASSDSLSDGSGPSAQEDSIAASVPPHPVVEVKPISPGSNTLPPNAATTASSQQNGATTQPNPVRRSGSNSGNNGGGGRGNGGSSARRAANNSGGGGSSGSGGDGHRNGGSIGSGCNSSNGDTSSGTSANDDDSIRNSIGNNNGNNNIRGAGSRSTNNNGDVNYRNSVGGSNHWNTNSRNNNGANNGGGGRGGYRGRRDHERGGNFSPRNYPRVMPYNQHQQQPGVYQQQPGTFSRPPPPPAAHFMMPQHFMPYVPTFPYHGDVQSYPTYLPPVEQFQNMHLVRPPMQPSWVPQEQPNLHEDIRTQIEFYFSTNNLCHDTFLRRQMNDQGWVPIELILGFNRMRAFTGLVDTSYILDAIRGSEILEVQGNNVRRHNDWADWLLR